MSFIRAVYLLWTASVLIVKGTNGSFKKTLLPKGHNLPDLSWRSHGSSAGAPWGLSNGISVSGPSLVPGSGLNSIQSTNLGLDGFSGKILSQIHASGNGWYPGIHQSHVSGWKHYGTNGAPISGPILTLDSQSAGSIGSSGPGGLKGLALGGSNLVSSGGWSHGSGSNFISSGSSNLIPKGSGSAWPSGHGPIWAPGKVWSLPSANVPGPNWIHGSGWSHISGIGSDLLSRSRSSWLHRIGSRHTQEGGFGWIPGTGRFKRPHGNVFPRVWSGRSFETGSNLIPGRIPVWKQGSSFNTIPGTGSVWTQSNSFNRIPGSGPIGTGTVTKNKGSY